MMEVNSDLFLNKYIYILNYQLHLLRCFDFSLNLLDNQFIISFNYDMLQSHIIDFLDSIPHWGNFCE